jgi:hypothetical protein
LKDVPALLELAIWKSKIMEQYDQNNNKLLRNMKKKMRIDSISMVTIIVPHVLSYLTDSDAVVDSDRHNGDVNKHDDIDDDSYFDRDDDGF